MSLIWLKSNLAVWIAAVQLLLFVAGVAWASGKKDHDLQAVKAKIEKVEGVADDTAKIVEKLKLEQKGVAETVDKIEERQEDAIRQTEEVKREQAAIKAIQSRIESDLKELHRDIKQLLQNTK